MNLKQPLIIALLIIAPALSYSQVKAGFAIGAGIPTGTLGDLTNFGFGGHLEGRYSVTEQIDVGLLFGWYGFFGGNLASGGGVSADVSGTRIVPITLTGDYVFPGGIYAGLGLGPYLVNFGELELSASGLGSASAEIGKETKFGVAPRVGFNPGSLNVSLTYHLLTDASFFGITIGMLVGF